MNDIKLNFAKEVDSLDVDQIYMTHFKPLADRKTRILNTIKLDLRWVESEPDSQYWTDEQDEWENRAGDAPYRQLLPSEISLAHKHIEAYKDIVAKGHQTALVLEDDVLLCNDFDHYFNRFLAATPDDWDLIFIGSGLHLRVDWCPVTTDQAAYKKSHPASKCTDSYCIKGEAAEKILSTIIPFSLPIDSELNYQMEIHDMNVFWWEPPIVTQGSECGLFPSAIRDWTKEINEGTKGDPSAPTPTSFKLAPIKK